MDSSASDKASGDVHLCVFVHGLWGNPGHLKNLAAALTDAFETEALHILIAKRNSGNYTYDGVETGAERVTGEIEDEIEELEKDGKKVTKFSMVGYSLGGLLARYIAGLLYSKGMFDKMQPTNFTTFATPHLGTRTPMLGWHSAVYNELGGRTLSSSGNQLWCLDNFRDTGRPLLAILADPSSIFMKGLACFKRRSLYANIVNDRAVPFHTAYISKTDPFPDLTVIDVHYAPGYDNVILDSDELATPRKTTPTWQDRANVTLGKLPFYFFLTVLAPIGGLVFLANAGVQSFQSAARIKQHQEGTAGVDTDAYRLPLMVQEMQHKAELALERLNTAEGPDYLPENEEKNMAKTKDDGVENGSTQSDRSSESEKSSKTSRSSRDKKLGRSSTSTSLMSPETRQAQEQPQEADTIEDSSNQSGFPTLALSDEQFEMKKHLDTVGFDKYAVHIQKVNHSHAAIIIRTKRFGFDEGKVVLRHWTERFET